MSAVLEIVGKIVLAGGSIIQTGAGTPQVATPTFSPAAGSYSSAQTVTISCATGGASIYYTTDGSTPTYPITGTTQLYSSPITVSTTQTVQAIGAEVGYTNSAVGSAAYTITSGATLVFDYANFASQPNTITVSYNASYSGGNIHMATANHSSGSIFYNTKQNIQSFTTVATFNFSASTSAENSLGIVFCCQNNTTPGSHAGVFANGDANGCGYGAYNLAGQTPILISAGVKIDMTPIQSTGGWNYTGGETGPSTTGMYFNSGPSGGLMPYNDMGPYGIDLYNGNTKQLTLVYDGSLMTMVLLDTVTGDQCRQSWPADIPTCCEADTAYIGFVCGQPPSASVLPQLLSWAYYTGFNTRLAAPTFNVASGSYTSSQTVTISYPAGSTCYYTTNGLQPTSASSLYSGPLTVSASECINAVAIQSGFTDSLVALANYQIQASGPTINFPSGFSGASHLITLVGVSYYNGSSIQLTDTTSPYESVSGSQQEIGAAWYVAPVTVTTFTTSFTLNFSDASQSGMCFVIQNFPSAASTAGSAASWAIGGPNALGGNGQALGYSTASGNGLITGQGFLASVAVKFDIQSGNTTGVYTGGAEPTTPQTSVTGVSFSNTTPIVVTLTYDGTTLTVAMVQGANNFSRGFGVNIPSAVGGNTAYVGFTGATSSNSVNQVISAWTGF